MASSCIRWIWVAGCVGWGVKLEGMCGVVGEEVVVCDGEVYLEISCVSVGVLSGLTGVGGIVTEFPGVVGDGAIGIIGGASVKGDGEEVYGVGEGGHRCAIYVHKWIVILVDATGYGVRGVTDTVIIGV